MLRALARGEPTRESDVDVFLVVADHDRPSSLALALGQAAREIHPGPYRTLHVTPGELRARWGSPLLRAIRAESVLLVGVPLERFA